jgi:hypothetical protein
MNRWTLRAVTVSVLFVCTTAMADPKDDANKKLVYAKFHRGINLYESQSYEAAYAEFKSAFEIVPNNADVVWNLAMSEVKTNRLVDAANHLRSYVRHPKAIAKNLAQAREKYLPMVDRNVGHVSVEGVDAAAAIYVDRVEVPWNAGDDVAVEPGTRHIEVNAGTDHLAMDVVATVGARVAARFMKPAPTTPPPVLSSAPMSVASTMETPASMSLPAPPPPSALPEQFPGATPRESDVDTSPSTRSTAQVATALTLLGAGLGSAVVGVVYAMNASRENDRWSDLRASSATSQCPMPGNTACLELQDAAEARTSDQNRARVFLAAGGALVVGAAVTWWLWPQSQRSGTATLRPIITPSFAGAHLRASF